MTRPELKEGIVTLFGEPFYGIPDIDRLDPFFMSVASDTDCWMFITSRGGLTAGRVDAEQSLFPYETVDKLHHGHFHTGPKTLIRNASQGTECWEPLNPYFDGHERFGRNLYKSVLGNWVVFEETHREWGLNFQADWRACDRFGWVRTVRIKNLSSKPVSLEVLDGIRNILPFGVPLALYQQSSSLADAYKQVDGDPGSTLATFSLTAKILDRAEAAEELHANTVWSTGLPQASRRFSRGTVESFKRGEALPSEAILKGQQGNYFLSDTLTLEPGEERRWYFGCNTRQTHGQIAGLQQSLRNEENLAAVLEAELAVATQNLKANLASADGLQATADDRASSHHLANVLFNNMRGGVFYKNDSVPKSDFLDFLHTRNRHVLELHQGSLRGMSDTLRISELRELARKTGDPQFVRLVLEYLPLGFGRRHGDPSRPWNRFAIHLKNPDGTPSLRYQGNWRDIFQNWEALGLSFPDFLSHFTAKFVNASTVDGYNPYRVTRDGIDWEVEEPEDPWSFIGYWGDHQIIYLLKFLEAQARTYPDALLGMLSEPVFSYAAVPYRLKDYASIVRDPKSTVVFDHDLDNDIDRRTAEMGTDGRLVLSKYGSVYLVTLLEKLLVTLLSKLSNFVPGGGIWLNTQRPEWNDANNALVGNGLSVVTLGYLRRYVCFLLDELESFDKASLPVSTEVCTWFAELQDTYSTFGSKILKVHQDNKTRRSFVDALGKAFERYRTSVYKDGFSGTRDLELDRVRTFLRNILPFLDESLKANRREDGLYHAYNLLSASPETSVAAVENLYLMLEGQVSALSSGAVNPEAALSMLQKMEESALFTEREQSYLLYPERERASFFKRNKIPGHRVEAIPLLSKLAQDPNEGLVSEDANGDFHFHASFSTSDDLKSALQALAKKEGWKRLVKEHGEDVLDVFELVFQHRSYTGRSGTMYGYEGLGCIYWHMVAKALLAVQEIALRAHREGAAPETVNGLIEAYYRLRKGLGFEKDAASYGAFPLDPYSHTPPQGGARQPGMTGQVKEEILTRFGELGVQVKEGLLCFEPWMLREHEFLEEAREFEHVLFDGTSSLVNLEKGSLGFTYGQVPVVYKKGAIARIRVFDRSGNATDHEGTRCPAAVSQDVFARGGQTSRIEVEIPSRDLR